MKKIILLFFICIALAGCNDDQERITISEDEIFEKKLECAQLQEQIGNNLPGDDDLRHIEERNLELILYSPIKNSCLYAVESLLYFDDQRTYVYNYRLYDALTTELLLEEAGCYPEKNSSIPICTRLQEDAKKSFYQQLDNYK